MTLETTRKPKVYIGYAREDIEAAYRLYTYLKEAGLEPLLDTEFLLPGQRWKVEITNAIRNSDYFIALFSSNSVDARGYVQKQLKEALDKLDEFPDSQIFLIPVRLDNCRLSEPRLSDLYMVDLFSDWRNGIAKILKSMNIDVTISGKGEGNTDISLSNVYWNTLLTLIDQKRCIPFTGPSASSFERDDGQPWIPTNMDIVRDWIKGYDYPFGGSDLNEHGYLLHGSYQLARAAQFIAIENNDEMYPKILLGKYIRERGSPDFSLPKYRNTPYALLADLDLRIYITTNYDRLMEEALKSRGKDPITEFCRWNEGLSKIPHNKESYAKYRPTKDEPLVFHLLGDVDTPESMVLTEKDYFDFVINLNREDEKEILPYSIRTELPFSSLLFLGYASEDLNFRTIFQGPLSFLGGTSRKISVAVQTPPFIEIDKKEKVVNYLNQYTKNMFDVYTYWGTVDNFVAEFIERWEEFQKDKTSKGIRSLDLV